MHSHQRSLSATCRYFAPIQTGTAIRMEKTAPCVVDRDQYTPQTSGTKAITSVTLYAFCTMSYIVAFVFAAIVVAMTANTMSTVRSTHNIVRSAKCLVNGCRTFSVNTLAGASNVPLAVDKIADSSAPKNSTWHQIGVLFMIRSGR